MKRGRRHGRAETDSSISRGDQHARIDKAGSFGRHLPAVGQFEGNARAKVGESEGGVRLASTRKYRRGIAFASLPAMTTRQRSSGLWQESRTSWALTCRPTTAGPGTSMVRTSCRFGDGKRPRIIHVHVPDSLEQVWLSPGAGVSRSHPPFSAQQEASLAGATCFILLPRRQRKQDGFSIRPM